MLFFVLSLTSHSYAHRRHVLFAAHACSRLLIMGVLRLVHVHLSSQVNAGLVVTFCCIAHVLLHCCSKGQAAGSLGQAC